MTAPNRRRANTILASLAIANFVSYASRNSLFAVYDDLRARFAGIGNANVGLLTTAFIVPHALATIAFGWAGDTYDRRRVIAFGFVVAAIGGLAGYAASVAESTALLAASRALVGFGTAALVPVANSIFGQLFAPEIRASRVAIFNLGLLVGGVVGFGGGIAFGFPWVLVALAVPCALLAVAIARLPVPPHPAAATSAARSGTFSRSVTTLWGDIKLLLRKRTLRWMIASATLMAFAAGGYNAWLLDFLVTDKGMTKGQATTLMSTAMLGAIAGIAVGGRVADMLRKRVAGGRLWTISIGMVSSLPLACLCVALPAGVALTLASIGALFFMFWYHAPMAVSVDELAPSERVVAAQALVICTMHLFGTAPSSYVIGKIADATGSLETAMWVPTAALALGAFTMMGATPSFAKDAASRTRDDAAL